jgi:hypothetical protein
MFNDMQSFSEIVVTVGGLVTLTAFVYAVYKIAKRIDGAIGVDDKGRSLSERMEKVEYQLWPNSGKSLSDRVNRVESSNTAIAAEIKIVKDLVTIIVDSHLQAERSKGKKDI